MGIRFRIGVRMQRSLVHNHLRQSLLISFRRYATDKEPRTQTTDIRGTKPEPFTSTRIDVQKHAAPHMLLSTRDHIEGRQIVEELGVVAGSSVKSRGLLFDLWARVRGLLGGELRSYGELLASSSSEATRRMMREAEHVGADGVVRVRYQLTSTADPASGAYCYVLCFGTAVKFQGGKKEVPKE